MILGNKIKKLRELHNYTQEYMAIELEMTQAGYSKIETGDTDVPFSRLENIAKILDVKVTDLINFDEKVLLNYGNNMGTNENTTGTVNNYRDDEMIKKLEQQYEARITSLEKEIERLYKLLEKSLGK